MSEHMNTAPERIEGMSDDAWIRVWLAEAVAGASDGELTAAAVMAAGCSFTAMGVPSLSMVRLVDAIEGAFDVSIDFGDGDALENLDTLTRFVADGVGRMGT